MEQNDLNIFETKLDETAKAHLLETTRWTKFLAVMGFIISGLMIAGAFVIMAAGSMFSSFSPDLATTGLGVVLGLVYLIFAALYTYPVYMLLKFSICIKKGINTGSQDLVNDGFRYQKNMYRFIGIMMIIIIAIYLLLFVVMGAGIMAGLNG